MFPPPLVYPLFTLYAAMGHLTAQLLKRLYESNLVTFDSDQISQRSHFREAPSTE